MSYFNHVRCDFCGKEFRREGHYRILEGWLQIDCQSRGMDGEICANPCQKDACPDCVRWYPVLNAIYKATHDPKATTENVQVSDAELLTWVDTWLDSARFDNRLSKDEQDACDVALSAVARLQGERE